MPARSRRAATHRAADPCSPSRTVQQPRSAARAAAGVEHQTSSPHPQPEPRAAKLSQAQRSQAQSAMRRRRRRARTTQLRRRSHSPSRAQQSSGAQPSARQRSSQPQSQPVHPLAPNSNKILKIVTGGPVFRRPDAAVAVAPLRRGRLRARGERRCPETCAEPLRKRRGPARRRRQRALDKRS